MAVVAGVERDHQVVARGGLVEGLEDVGGRDRGHRSVDLLLDEAASEPATEHEQDNDWALAPGPDETERAPARTFVGTLPTGRIRVE